MFSTVVSESEYKTPILTVTVGDNVMEVDIQPTTKRSGDLSRIFEVSDRYINENCTVEEQHELIDLIRASMNIPHMKTDIEYVEAMREIIDHGVDLLNYYRFVDWFRENHDGLYIAPNTEDEFVYDPDSGTTRDRTYLLDEYIELVGLVTFVRALFPVFNEYMAYCLKADKHPYYRLYTLFKGTAIDDPDHALEKLGEYIDATHSAIHGNKGRENMIIIAGLSDDDIVAYLSGEAIFKKLLLKDCFNTEFNPISHIYGMIKHDGEFRSSNTRISLKAVRDTGDDDYGVHEDYRRTTDLSMGINVEIQVALEDERDIVRGLGYDPETFDWGFYKRELKNIQLFLNQPVDRIQRYLLGWLLKDVNPRSLFLIDERRVVELMLLAKTCLYMSGQEYIGSFLGSIYDDETSFVSSGAISKGTLSKGLAQELSEMYKFHINDRGVTYEKVVLDVSRHIANIPWRPQGHNENGFVNKEGFLLIPSNINEVVVDYIRFILNIRTNKE